VQVTHGGAQRTLRAPLIVGADGLRTVVGRRLGLVRRGRRPSRMALVMHYAGVADVGACGEMHVFADGYVGVAPVGHGITNVAIVIPTARGHAVRGDPEGFADAWLAARPALATRFTSAQRLERPVATGPFNQRAARAWAPGAVLVGDAADFFDPFTGEGIYAALRGAELLTPYAFEAARASPQRHDVALAAYDRCRGAAFRGKWAVERMVGSAVGVPWLLNRAAAALSRQRDMADLLVGVTGDFVPAHRILRPGYLLPLLYGLVRGTDARQATVALPSSSEVPARVRP
jgi:flavin-dependent dehydrogenase